MSVSPEASVLAYIFKRHAGHNHSDHVEEVPQCEVGNSYDGQDHLRVVAIFVILITSAIGTIFPLLSTNYSRIRLPSYCFFFAKYFGSGVIVATGFIHLLQPANENLSNECLGGVFAQYPWAFAICMMALFSLFFVEINTHHFVHKSNRLAENGNVSGKSLKDEDSQLDSKAADAPTSVLGPPGNKHFSHDEYHQDIEQANGLATNPNKEQYSNQLISLFILEFGVVFHSILIGLALAVSSSEEFVTLFVVLIFHQMFEGLGLGTRIAEASWGSGKSLTPWLLAFGYSLATPLAIAVGLGIKHSFAPESRQSLIVNGIFDAISAGVLIYTGLIELMAHEFLFSNSFKGENGYTKMMYGFIIMCFGAGSMSLLGRWA
ncbi:low-affinity Zn(2+) transporter ZRT2 Ecym_4202 [Eremothecium cymbalariae DBVPG|uniref:Uncharacterized protein n=1 Tax=Eremothecium cymbalariae (strain CBS 270.75 / DBVPG 7215 / KCTC 17166 / NRRL Y-17582) TaxID=931890 RepID=G8JTB7_ERECY|nr:hypothetical protein Ecym_4202 [Eremothecium cymbalariae DBVPG\